MADPTNQEPKSPPLLGLGDRIRSLTDQLRQERTTQIQATARILGAAAQMAVNHDRLITEVVEMVETDLDQAPAILAEVAMPYTVEQLKRQFKSFKVAKAHFQLPVKGWADLVQQLNQQGQRLAAATPVSPAPTKTNTAGSDVVLQRLDRLEQQLETIQRDVGQILIWLTQHQP